MTFPRFDGVTIRCRFVTPCYVRVTIRHGVARLRPVEAVTDLLLGSERQLTTMPGTWLPSGGGRFDGSGIVGHAAKLDAW